MTGGERPARPGPTGLALAVAFPLVLAVDALALALLIRGAHLARGAAIVLALSVSAGAWLGIGGAVDAGRARRRGGRR